MLDPIQSDYPEILRAVYYKRQKIMVELSVQIDVDRRAGRPRHAAGPAEAVAVRRTSAFRALDRIEGAEAGVADASGDLANIEDAVLVTVLLCPRPDVPAIGDPVPVAVAAAGQLAGIGDETSGVKCLLAGGAIGYLDQKGSAHQAPSRSRSGKGHSVMILAGRSPRIITRLSGSKLVRSADRE